MTNKTKEHDLLVLILAYLMYQEEIKEDIGIQQNLNLQAKILEVIQHDDHKE